MNKIWDRDPSKSEASGRWWRGWKNEWSRKIDKKSNAKME